MVNFLYFYAVSNFTETIVAYIRKQLFKCYLQTPYKIYVNKNSSYLSKAIIGEANNFSFIINSFLIVLSELFIVVLLYALMLFVSFKITLVFSVIFSLKVILLKKIISTKIRKAGKNREFSEKKIYEILNRVFGNFKQIKLQAKKIIEETNNNYSEHVNRYAQSRVLDKFFSQFPRLFLETAGFCLLSLLLVVLLYRKQSNIIYILPTLSLFVLSMYRILPSINRIVGSYNSFIYYHKSVDVLYDELKTEQEYTNDNKINFKHTIKLDNVVFSYKTLSVLNDINLTINKGDKIAFVGESGAGKSTLADIIIGLYRPNSGCIKIDGALLNDDNLQNWRSQIGYVPQQVYLFDGTVADNICFGRQRDDKILEDVLKQANIYYFLQTKEGLETLVGEGGIQLSGGQKQRIAIARALYGNPEILVLDEATSALDNDTEEKIMKEIYHISKDKTLIVIAHRLTTIKGCDKVFKIKNKLINV